LLLEAQKIKSPGTNQIPAEVIQATGNTLNSENGDKLTMKEQHFQKLRAKLYPIFLSRV
jgi:hypothetical protein